MSSRQVPDWIDGYLEYTAETEAMPIFRKWAAVSTIAGCLMRKCYAEYSFQKYYPNMYIVLVGPSGRARKGTAMKPALPFLEHAQVHLSPSAASKEALARRLSEGAKNDIDPTTGESFRHHSMTIFSEELTVMLRYNDLDFLAWLCDWYDCKDPWVYETKNVGKDNIRGIWVNLFGATTPRLVQTTLPQDAIGGGLTSRIIFVYSDKFIKKPYHIFTDREIALRDMLMHDIEDIVMTCGEFRVTPSLLEKYIPWYLNDTLDTDGPLNEDIFGSYFSRRATHIWKLMMVFNASRHDGNMLLTDQDFDRALSFLDLTERDMPKVFAGVGQSRIADVQSRVLAYLSIKGTCTFKQLMLVFMKDVDRQTMFQILAVLKSVEAIDYGNESGETTIYFKGGA